MGFVHLRLLAVMTLVIVLGAAASAHAAGEAYVALGDSYTSGPLIPNQHGQPIDCGRSDHNYPSLVAAALKVASFTDVSCGSAETRHMTEPQTGLPLGGTNPPQFNALGPNTTLVTIGIGGNDAGLVSAAEQCGVLGLTKPTGHACRDYWAPGGNDKLAARIAATAPKIAAVLQGIHQRSPKARVAIVGYPDPVPKNGGSCWPMVPLSPDDVAYIDSVLVRINAMIRDEAGKNGAEYVDTYTDSIGHDVCKLPPNRWFEGLVPTEPAFPMHPNAKGEASMARSVYTALTGKSGGPGPGAGSGGIATPSNCLSRRPPIGARRIGRIRLGYTRRALARHVRMAPAKKSRLAWVYCTRGSSNRVAAVFSKRSRKGRVEFLLSTAPSKAFRRSYPHRQRLANGLFRSSPHGRRLIYSRRGHVVFVAVMERRLFTQPKRLNRDLIAALR